MRGSEEITWQGGEHSFRLGIGELRAIEQRSDAGCAVVMMRLLSSQWKIDDVINPIRLGLIGGGMEERLAQKAIEAALDVASPYALAVTSADVLRRFIMWETDDQPGEPKAVIAKES
ncbi:gene transfer agent family protein [Rhizobium leguminosarum]|uniref:gene transfer agent family protein n=1 Tax=Rhizobium leguminosarum TaxID=384 RepID=UPI00103B526D|nr:gene transfer agent family protein [Rhizobium leguminosarum]MBY5503139.1 gene transfer agent family protein [Rhizobium leguminosarum]NKK31555.1 gene transfer agent family protein [Rhizobium leguminosarum bv. viciae]TBZ40312.1 gene transfer agent family protein [Rhizobium leguminosarum bv. viciae]